MDDEIIIGVPVLERVLARLERAEARAAHYRAALEELARPGTGYRTWHTAAARTALDTAPPRLAPRNPEAGQ